ncbi:hypothetical protein BDY21DRAFT_350752 [Lineolata rhizophorae]|uniref:Uncharacterized protein n=1 Tax=Lineolata rhizophorae TaxID=578093 RepID=A0A6A6NUE6_9PEZI|nr:hypothetical protein BDY21DRAFT_350752 [Lineolata rhizophorae]
MPIRTNRIVRDANQRFRPNDPRTAVFALNERPPAYKPPVPTERVVLRGRVESPTLERDLSYFHEIVTGKLEPEKDKSPTLVLNLYRATLTHQRPIAERLTLGQTAGAPYYALYATPNTTSMDEFNTLVITRRSPNAGGNSDAWRQIHSAVYSDACTSIIQPRLNLHASGSMLIANLSRAGLPYTLSWSDRSTAGKLGDCFCVWDSRDGSGVAQMYSEEGWQSLDDSPLKGIIRIKRSRNLNSDMLNGAPDFEDPRFAPELAYLDFSRHSPQFVCQNSYAHENMDIIAAALLTVLVVMTRKMDQIREMGSLPAYRP